VNLENKITTQTITQRKFGEKQKKRREERREKREGGG